MGDIENVGSQPQRLMMSQRLRRSRALAHNAPIGLRFENEKVRQSRKKLKRRKSLEFLFRRNVVSVLEHAALLLRKSEILLGPRDKFVVRDEAVRLHPVEARDGGELIVFDEQKNLVVRALAGPIRGQKDFRSVVRIAPAEIFVAKKSLELVVERSHFRASHFARERKRNMPALDLRSKMAMMHGNAHVPRREPICGP